jgi:hypothetical protein
MSGELIVRPDKNEFLLYAMLIAAGHARGHADDHPLKQKTAEHFKGYQGTGLQQREYGHHSKPVGYVLTLHEAPDLSERQGLTLDACMQQEVKYGKTVLPHLKQFYQNTDFEEFYQETLPAYREECDTLRHIVEKTDLCTVLDDAWELDGAFRMEVIPMPLESYRSGIGPSVGDTAYQIVGPPFDADTPFLIAHEGSHPRAKKTLKPIADEIAARGHHLTRAMKHKNYSNTYQRWPTCFEEHFVRAVQTACIDTVLYPEDSIERGLQREENRQGMVFIRDFYEEVRQHKEHPTGPLTDVARRILERLDDKYGRADAQRQV